MLYFWYFFLDLCCVLKSLVNVMYGNRSCANVNLVFPLTSESSSFQHELLMSCSSLTRIVNTQYNFLQNCTLDSCHRGQLNTLNTLPSRNSALTKAVFSWAPCEIFVCEVTFTTVWRTFHARSYLIKLYKIS